MSSSFTRKEGQTGAGTTPTMVEGSVEVAEANLGCCWTTTFDDDNRPWAFAFNDVDYGWPAYKSQALSVRCVKIQ